MNYSCIIREAPMRMMNPSVMVSRLDLVVLELAAAGIVFRRLPQGFWIFGVFIEQRGGVGGVRGGHNPPGRAWAPRRAQVGCAPLGAPLLLPCPIVCLLVQKKSPKSFAAFGLRLGLIFYDVKNKQKNSNWHWALCQ